MEIDDITDVATLPSQACIRPPNLEQTLPCGTMNLMENEEEDGSEIEIETGAIYCG